MALGRLMGWISVTHVRRHREHYHRGGAGHLYQGRYKSFSVAEDHYFLTHCRYVEANTVRAKLVERAEQWRWGGLWRRTHREAGLPLSTWPLDRPWNWSSLVNADQAPEELKVVRECVARDCPLGTEPWVQSTAERLRLAFTLRGPGRPRKIPNS
jgi:putative transposase